MTMSCSRDLCTVTPYFRDPLARKSTLRGTRLVTVRDTPPFRRLALIEPSSATHKDIRGGPREDRKRTQTVACEVPRRVRRGVRSDPGDRALHALSGMRSTLPLTMTQLSIRAQNMLRKRTYWDHYGPLDDTYQRDPAFYRVHLGQYHVCLR